MKRIFIAYLISFISFTLFAIEPNLISSQTFSKIQNLDFQLTYENISIETIYGNEFLLEIYSNNKKKIPEISCQDDNLLIQSQTNLNLYPSDYCNIRFYIPKELMFEDIYLTTQTGNINFEKLDSKNIEIHTFDGKISGESLVSQIQTCLSTQSGSIDIYTVKNETISASSTNGSIYFTNFTSDYFDVKTDSGFIEICFEHPPRAYSSIISNSGIIQISFRTNEGFCINAFSTSGLFLDDTNNSRQSIRKDFHKDFFDGGAEINIKSISGNIILKK